MTYKGYVRNGVVVASGPLPLPEGTEVRIEVVAKPKNDEEAASRSLADRLSDVIGVVEGMPADWSENHDKYLREQYRQ